MQVGKMVNLARVIGLDRDPDDYHAKVEVVTAPNGRKSRHRGSDASHSSSQALPAFTLFESEMRRRMWWDVFYYDLSASLLVPNLMSNI